MTQQVQGQQTETRGKAQVGIALAGAAVRSASSGAAGALVSDHISDHVPDMASETAPMDEGNPAASGSGWAIDLQETLYLRPPRTSTPPTQSIAALTPDDDVPQPKLGGRSLAITLLCCLLLLVVVGALDGMQQYARIHAQVDDARSHLQAAQSLLSARQAGQPLDPATLSQVGDQLAAAQTNFDELQAELASPSGVALVGTFVPRLSSRIAAAANLARGGDDTLEGLESLIAASNDILEMRADGYLDANGAVTRLGRRSPASGLLVLHLHAALANAIASFGAADAIVTPTDLALLPSTLVRSSNLVSLDAQLATWPQARAQLLAPNGWRLLLPFVLGTRPNQ